MEPVSQVRFDQSTQLVLERISTKEPLEAFLSRAEVRPYAQFFQTWEWGEFQKARGQEIHRLAVLSGSEVIATVLLVQEKDRLGPFLYGARGPATDFTNHAQANAILRLLSRESQKLSRKPMCLRLDPAIVHGAAEADLFPTRGYRNAGKFTQVERDWIVDLKATEEDQLAWQKAHGMRKNVSYSLRRAHRDGVTVRISDDPKDLEIFLDILSELDERKHGVFALPREYYRMQFASLAPSGYERVCLAELNGEPLAGAVVAFYGREASYLWGASYDRERQLSAPHFLHFKAMRHAYESGCERYNFWGVVADKNYHPGHRGYGFSQFKKSFGGYMELYIRAQDYVYRPFPYAVTWLGDVYRGRKRQLD